MQAPRRLAAAASWNRCHTRRYLAPPVAAGYIATAVLSHHIHLLWLGLVWLLFSATSWIDLNPRVDSVGIRRPAGWGDLRRIAWSRVEGVRMPRIQDQFASVRLRDGRIVALTNFAAHQSAEIAALGQVAVLPAEPVQPMPRPTNPPTVAEQQNALDRRLRELRQQAEALRSGLRVSSTR